MALALLWKERGIPSQEALSRLLKTGDFTKRKGRQGIGHAGTLDPFAEGWLLVGVDEGTKFLSVFQGFDKEYEASMLLGVSSRSLDTDEALEPAPAGLLENFLADPHWEEKLIDHLKTSIGVFEQVPPQFSAIRVGGSKRAYDFAREGKIVELKARRAEIFAAEHLNAEILDGQLQWRFRVRVSSGTYIRSLARDWGEKLLGSPGLLNGLVRTRISTLGADLPRSGVHFLKAQDLSEFFDIERISDNEVEALRSSGRWHPRPGSKAQLLVGDDAGPIAFTEAETGLIGRVFLSNPFDSRPS
jgi:tRNA pseudouridine55 synthase